MKCQLVMPMCGRGSRFSRNGEIIPKPLIVINDKPFFYWSTISLIKLFLDYESLTFVVLKEHIENYHIDIEIKKYFKNAKIVVLDDVPNGPVFTCLAGCRNLEKNMPVIFNDCDHAFISSHKIDPDSSYLFCFSATNPNYSYALTNQNGKLVRVYEKKVISEMAICGAYLFDTVDNFIKYANDYVSLGNEERFMSGVVDLLCKEKDVKISMLKEHVSFGTPEEYNEAIVSQIFKELESENN